MGMEMGLESRVLIMLYSGHVDFIVATTASLVSFHSVPNKMSNGVRISCFDNVVFRTPL